MNYYFSKGMQNSDRSTTRDLCVNNSGYYKSMDEPLEIVRPNGRGDYQLLFCARGSILVGEEILERGDAFLYFPHQKQVYTYLPAPDSLYYWVHFTGTQLPSLLQKAELSCGKHACASKCTDLEQLLRMLVASFGKNSPTDAPLAASLLCAILMILPSAKSPVSPFAAAVKQLEDLSRDVEIKDLANMYKMSTAHFIRAFRSYLGLSPYQYRRRHQLDLAKMLLIDSRLSVSKIAARIGIDDPLYFSRIFKKYVGVSPSDYRKE